MCTSPILVKCKDAGFRRVPCGHCCECLMKYQNSWKARMMFERMAHDTPTYFVTLTYADEHMPYVLSDDKGICGITYVPQYFTFKRPDGTSVRTDKIRSYIRNYTIYRGSDLFTAPDGCYLTPTVYHKDIQDWIKRNRISFERSHKCNLRKDKGFAYFFTSEYGPKRLRPHYHGLIFGLDRDTIVAWCRDWTNHFGRHSNKKCNVSIEEVRGDGAANYVSKYCSKGFYDHPFCSKQIRISFITFDARVRLYLSTGYYFDSQGAKRYEIPEQPCNYMAAPRVLDTFHLVSKGLGLSKGLEYVCNALGCPNLFKGIDFSNRKSLLEHANSIQKYVKDNFTFSQSLKLSDGLFALGLSPTQYYFSKPDYDAYRKISEHPEKFKSRCPISRVRLFDDCSLVTDEGAEVFDRVRKFTVVGVDKNGNPKNYSYLLPRYYQKFFLPEGSSASLSYSTRLSQMADKKLIAEFETLLSIGQTPTQAFRSLYKRQSNDCSRRTRKSFEHFCEGMDALSNSSLDE